MMFRNTPMTEKEKAFRRRQLKIKHRFSEDKTEPAFKATREFLTVVRADYVPAKPRGRSGTRLDPRIRELVAQKAARRAAFFASLKA